MKFGGSLLGSKVGLSRVIGIVGEHRKEHQLVLVVSALGETTDLLQEASRAARKWNEPQVDHFLNLLQKGHVAAVERAHLGSRSQSVKTEIGRLLGSLKILLVGISMLGELTPRTSDLILSYGERLSAIVVSSALTAKGIRTRVLTGGGAGIITDNSFGEAAPLFPTTRREVRKNLRKYLRAGIVPVVTGFIAQSETGEVTTLGRGGSDYTATIIADAIDADEVWIWTDVGGIMTADPRLVKNARVIEELSHAEAEEMAFFGAKNMHPLSLAPARVRRIPVRIKNGFNPQSEGTLIHWRERKSPTIAKSVSLIRNVGMLTVSGEILAGRPGTAAAVFEILGASGINILMISQSVSESNISMVIRRNQLGRAALALSGRLPHLGIKALVETESSIAALQVVGAGMKGTPGVAAKLFTALAGHGLNVRMIAQGSSELNISFVLAAKDGVKAVRILHESLVLSR